MLLLLHFLWNFGLVDSGLLDSGLVDSGLVYFSIGSFGLASFQKYWISENILPRKSIFLLEHQTALNKMNQ